MQSRTFFSITAFLFFLVTLTAQAKVHEFDCRNLSGTYECKGHPRTGMVELSGHEITFIDDAVMPISYKIDSSSKEASSEKQHVSYSGSCNKKRIHIKASVTDINIDGSTKNQRVETTLSFTKHGELAVQYLTQAPNLLTLNGAICIRVEAE